MTGDPDSVVGRLLGPDHGDEPTTVELMQQAEGADLPHLDRARFLDDHPAVARAIAAGLDELDRQRESPREHLVVELDRPLLRAAAATDDEPPGPDGRRVLDEVEGVYRLVLYRHNTRLALGLFCHDPKVEASLLITDADRPGWTPRADALSAGVLRADLGRADRLHGRCLRVEARVGPDRRDCTVTLVPGS